MSIEGSHVAGKTLFALSYDYMRLDAMSFSHSSPSKIKYPTLPCVPPIPFRFIDSLLALHSFGDHSFPS